MAAIYLFSGLGADLRVFADYSFPGFEKRVIAWREPAKNETLAAYAKSYQKIITEEAPILIGVSFGGMVVAELSQQIPGSKCVFISSAPDYKHVPWLYKIFGRLLINFVPKKLLNKPNALLNWFFKTETNSSKQLLKDIIRDTSPVFASWAIQKIGSWKGSVPKDTEKLIIHGTSDRILPKIPTGSKLIKGGGHFMIVDRRNDISLLISNWLKIEKENNKD